MGMVNIFEPVDGVTVWARADGSGPLVIEIEPRDFPRRFELLDSVVLEHVARRVRVHRIGQIEDADDLDILGLGE